MPYPAAPALAKRALERLLINAIVAPAAASLLERRFVRGLRGRHQPRRLVHFTDTLIRHQSTSHAISRLRITMIEAPFFARLVPRACSPFAHDSNARFALIAAVALPPVARAADVEDPKAPTATFLAETLVQRLIALRPTFSKTGRHLLPVPSLCSRCVQRRCPTQRARATNLGLRFSGLRCLSCYTAPIREDSSRPAARTVRLTRI